MAARGRCALQVIGQSENHVFFLEHDVVIHGQISQPPSLRSWLATARKCFLFARLDRNFTKKTCVHDGSRNAAAAGPLSTSTIILPGMLCYVWPSAADESERLQSHGPVVHVKVQPKCHFKPSSLKYKVVMVLRGDARCYC